MTQNNFFYNLNRRLADVTGESHERVRETEIANEAALSTVESVFAKMNSQPAGQVVREADSDKLAALRDKLPFEPDAEAPSHKDEFGNEIKHMARHLARMGMHDAERSLEREDDVEEDIDTGEYDARKTTPSGDSQFWDRQTKLRKSRNKAAQMLGYEDMWDMPEETAEWKDLVNKLMSGEQLDELSPLRTRLYKQAAEKDAKRQRAASDRNASIGNDWAAKAHGDQYEKRVKGIDAADRRLSKEDIEAAKLDKGRDIADAIKNFNPAPPAKPMNESSHELLDYFISLFTPGGKRDARATPEQVEKAFKAADREYGPLEHDFSSENVVAGYLNELFGLKPNYSMAEEKKAEKDYDGDGKIETSTQEFLGSRDRAIKAAMKRPQSIKESMDDSDFIDYVFSFYGPGGIYDMGATKDQIADAMEMYRSKEETDYAADSFDRENIRDILIDQFGLEFPEGGIKMGDIHLDEDSDFASDDFQRVARKARDISERERCAQHVNREPGGYFRISDWYDADETVASFEDGRQLSGDYELDENILSELSPETLKSYAKKASQQSAGKAMTGMQKRHAGDIEGSNRDFEKAIKRQKGVGKAIDRALGGLGLEEEEEFINIGGKRVKNTPADRLAHVQKTFPNVKKINDRNEPVFKESDMSDALSDAAHELALFADNDSQLYRSSETPIKTNLEKKAKRGVYDSELAKKLWKYHADRAAQSYAQQHGDGTPWQRMFTPDDRRQAAAYWEEAFREELMANGILDEQFIMEREDDEDSYWDFKDLKDEPTSRVRKVAGRAYGGSAQVDDEEDDEETSSAPKRRGRPAGTAKKTGARRPGVYEDSEILKAGSTVKVPHKGKMVPGKIVRYDSGKGGYSPAYVVDIGEYESKIVPVHDVKRDVAEGNYHDADFVNKSERLERLRALAKRQGDREAFDRYNSEIKKLYGSDITHPGSTFDESFDAEINPAKRGMFAGKDKAELQKQYNRLKASGPHKQGSPEFTKMRELAFAIRAKSGWGKVNK